MNHTDGNFGNRSLGVGQAHVPVTEADRMGSTGAGRSIRTMPDVAAETAPEVAGNLQRVGMSGVELMIRWDDESGPMRLPAVADAYVSLENDQTKGIHMSRLYLALTQRLESEALNGQTLGKIVDEFLSSHREMSHEASLAIRFSLPAWRPALLSDHSAPRHYPVGIRMDRREEDGQTRNRLFVNFQVVYSSTCPCSAALSRQLLQQKFQNDFAFHRWVSVSNVEHWLLQHGSLATPHSQRSVATIDIELQDAEISELPLKDLIQQVESALKTAVQAVVKRQDEQEFARLNGANQMFCEDAARRMKAALEPLDSIADYRIEARHMESLHPHDATAITVKGRIDGLKP